MLKKTTILMAAILAGVFSLSGCGEEEKAAAPTAAAEEKPQTVEPIVIRVGHDAHPGEPFYAGCEKWKELLEAKSNGTMQLELYPSGQLGSKDDLLDQIATGEAICTLADGAYFYDRGVKDFGIVFGPYLFDSWDEAYKLYESSWYQEQADKLAEVAKLKIVASNWRFGVRHTLTTKPVQSLADFHGIKLRVPTNVIQLKGMEVLGTAPTPMALGEVYTALQQGTIDGVENPVALLYYGKFHEVAKYLLLDSHVYNITNLVVGVDFFNSLTKEQQQMLMDTCKEAGLYQNKLSEESDTALIKKMQDEGVTVIEPTPEFKQELKEASKKFYTLPDFKDWSPNLYETVKAAMK
ncbi:C4-dicarboxylate TRAP transporter substrate-binding protein [Succinatimonas hippei]|uniref:C4-dicarboxylate TRAP transporter substrate-binding protein n=1 Tax=Succinatimonas hippei TaxID=626938 RepID=UPI0020138C93|nr:C4-dicarboxylate TRAP transporter substrate-binding protein [Succinatimonas hippei]MCL1602291.1 C4-dicarboxylate TRAP transporter substrate-binding protein [Succinatimonas hippei]MDM8119558.1 C4-dicarboxylate TRAP transporter substrate-binding protein [Succinatimonas hippei]